MIMKLFAGELEIAVEGTGSFYIHEDSHSQCIKVCSPISGSHCFEWDSENESWTEYNGLQTLDSFLEFQFMDLTDGYLRIM